MSLQAVDESLPFVVECDASDMAISATLNQRWRPVKVDKSTELHYSSVEKEATAIIEVVRNWRHFLACRHFILVTDQQSVSYMFDNRRRTKVKNNKIQYWRLELASFSYQIQYRPGKDNNAADTLAQTFCSTVSPYGLEALHQGLRHPGLGQHVYCICTF